MKSILIIIITAITCQLFGQSSCDLDKFDWFSQRDYNQGSKDAASDDTLKIYVFYREESNDDCYRWFLKNKCSSEMTYSNNNVSYLLGYNNCMRSRVISKHNIDPLLGHCFPDSAIDFGIMDAGYFNIKEALPLLVNNFFVSNDSLYVDIPEEKRHFFDSLICYNGNDTIRGKDLLTGVPNKFENTAWKFDLESFKLNSKFCDVHAVSGVLEKKVTYRKRGSVSKDHLIKN